MKKALYILSACALMFTVSCSSDYLELQPNSSASTGTIFETTDNVKLAVNGLSKLMTKQYLGQQGCNGEGTIRTWYGNYPGNDYQKSNLTGWSSIINSLFLERSTSLYDYYPWFYYYKVIGNANSVICRTDDAAGTDAEKAFLKAQALTFRAYCYSQLLQLYSKRWMDSNNGSSRGVILRIDESKDEMPASTQAQCYERIYKDLDEAIKYFNECGIKRGKDEKHLPDVNAAYAVYAYAALHREDWPTAAKYAKMAREGHPLLSGKDYPESGFSADNDEWIWNVFSNEEETLYFYQFFSFESSNSSASICRNYPVAISKELYDQIPETDVRRGMFLAPMEGENYDPATGLAGTAMAKRARKDFASKLFRTTKVFAYMSFKHLVQAQPGVGEFALFRASEMYLIEAEAYCHMPGKESEAQGLLCNLNHDSGRDPNYVCTKTGQDLLDEVRLYYRIEMFGEGRDWFNYKRWGLPIVRHDASHGGSFHKQFAVTINPQDSNGWTWVIPNKEIDYNTAISSPLE